MQPNLPGILQDISIIKSARDIFLRVLGSQTPVHLFHPSHIQLSDNGRRLYEFTANQTELAEAVFGADFPRVSGPIELNHFTTVNALSGMIQSRSIHLRSLGRSLTYHEFQTYAKTHSLDGYFEFDTNGKQVFENLSDDLFYLSTTPPEQPYEAEMWSRFADEGKGVRLLLRITPTSNADLRTMAYQLGTPTALQLINDELMKQHRVAYSPWGVSRIAAFMVTKPYHVEQEVRLLVKLYPQGFDGTKEISGYRVWPVDLVAPGGASVDLAAKIELLSVTAGDRCRPGRIRDLLAGTPYAAVPVV